MLDLISVTYSYHDTSLLFDLLSNTRISHDGEFLNGYLGDLRMKYKNSSLTITGSLTKFYWKDNIVTPSFSEYSYFTSQMKDLLNIPSYSKGTITRFEIGTTILCDLPVPMYFPAFQPTGRYQLSQINMRNGNGVYAWNTIREIVAYDKISEMRTKRVPTWKDHHGKHLLRIELRMRRRVRQQLARITGIKTTYFEDLFEPATAIAVLRYFEEQFDYITRDHQVSKKDYTLVPSHIKNELAARSIVAAGGPTEILREFQDHLVSGRMTRRRYRSLRALLTSLVKDFSAKSTRDLARELTEKFHNAIQQEKERLLTDKIV